MVMNRISKLALYLALYVSTDMLEIKCSIAFFMIGSTTIEEQGFRNSMLLTGESLCETNRRIINEYRTYNSYQSDFKAK